MENRAISLEQLRAGFPFVPAACGEFHAQAAFVCLTHHGHLSGVELTIRGDLSDTFQVEWQYALDQATMSYWRDLSGAVEQGAVGLAILLVRQLTGLTVVERAVKGTGIDW